MCLNPTFRSECKLLLLLHLNFDWSRVLFKLYYIIIITETYPNIKISGTIIARQTGMDDIQIYLNPMCVAL